MTSLCRKEIGSALFRSWPGGNTGYSVKVRLILIGPLKLPSQGRIIEFQTRKGTKLRTILRKMLNYTPKELGFIQIIHDGRTVHLDEVITEDIELRITMRLGGG